MDSENDLCVLSRDDLEEECIYLKKKCKQLLEASEDDAQRIHELKRSLDLATAAERYLTQELEQLTASATKSEEFGRNTKLQTEYDDLRRKHQTLNIEFGTLQDDYQSILDENSELKTKVKTLSNESSKENANDDKEANEKLTERLNTLEHENVELLQKLEDNRDDKIQHTMALADRDKKIELMQDEVSCLEENMRYKRDELEEKTRMLESAQEQLYEANTKISMLTSSPDNKDRKGNSLFAEVDDQRQAMKQILAAQKKHYQEMKKIYNESQFEIRRLKRENSACHKELQTCSAIFCNADKTYQEKQNGRIRQLLKDSELLEQKLKWTEQNLKDLATERGVNWLDSMLNFCKKETDDLKKQLHSTRIENATLEQQLRDLKQEMARWRFESLQSRCLLTDRENLLTENAIDFKLRNAQEYRLTDKQIRTSAPVIICLESKTTSEKKNSINNTATKDSEESKTPAVKAVKTKSGSDNSTDSNKENDITPVKIIPSLAVPKTPPFVGKILQNTQKKSEQRISPQKELKIPAESPNPKPIQNIEIKSVPNTELPSILCGQRNILSDAPGKSVRFNEKENTVFNLSVDPETSIESKDDSMDCNTKVVNETGTTVKTIRTKSNVVVRHFVVNSKPK